MYYRSFLLTGLLSLLTSHCASFVKIPVVTQMPPIFAKRMIDVKVIAIAPPAATVVPETGEYDWALSAAKALQSTLGEQRYFVLVDGTAAAETLRGYAAVDLPRPPDEAKLAKSLGVDGFLYMQITGPATSNCLIRSYQTKREQCSGFGTARSCTVVYEIRYESTRHTTIPIRGKLVSTKTQNTIAFADKAVHTATTQGSGCVSAEWSTALAIENGAEMLATAISPTIADMEIPLDSDPDGTPAEKEAEVKTLLKAGVEFAEKQEYRNAKGKWQQALDISQGKSAGAHWNMAVTFWMAGDYTAADEHFRRSKEITGLHFANDREKTETLQKFYEEKNHFETTKAETKTAINKKK